ncbi:MAG: tetratricopeptide repeat protein [Elusimicrobia bacterium]|nr:tetratricopeptide repeat protein [Elusimicrobiota bacterium]
MKRRFFFPYILIGLMAFPQFVLGEEAEPALFSDPEVQSAAQLLEKGDWAGARRKMERYLDFHKKSSEAWLVFGQTYLPQKKFKKAVRRFRKALKHNASYAPAYYWLGKTYEEWGKVDEAVNEYQAAFRADPKMEAARESWKRLASPD